MPSAPLMLKFGHLIFAVCDVAFMKGKMGSKLQNLFLQFMLVVLVISQWIIGKLYTTKNVT